MSQAQPRASIKVMDPAAAAAALAAAAGAAPPAAALLSVKEVERERIVRRLQQLQAQLMAEGEAAEAERASRGEGSTTEEDEAAGQGQAVGDEQITLHVASEAELETEQVQDQLKLLVNHWLRRKRQGERVVERVLAEKEKAEREGAELAESGGGGAQDGEPPEAEEPEEDEDPGEE